MPGLSHPRAFRGLRNFPLDGRIPPTLTSANFSTVYAGGGDRIIINGTGFIYDNPAVSWGGTACNVVSKTLTSVTITTPAKTASDSPSNLIIDGSNALSIVPWSPSLLDLTTFYQASFTGSPWVGRASLGSSLNRNLTEATNPPSVGAAKGNIAVTPASFDASNDILSTGATVDTVFGQSSYCGVAIAKMNSSNRTLLNGGSAFRLAYLAASGAIEVYSGDTGFVGHSAGKVCSLGTDIFIAYKLDLTATGAELRIMTNGTWGTAVACSTGFAPSQVGGLIKMGENVMDGLVYESATMKGAVMSDATLTKWRSCASCRYGVTY